MRSPKAPSAGARGREYDRHVSGTGTRGLPKKGGAGGKGVWGAAMDQEGVACLDNKDPNYDSDQEQQQQPPALQLGANAPAPTTTAAPAELAGVQEAHTNAGASGAQQEDAKQ